MLRRGGLRLLAADEGIGPMPQVLHPAVIAGSHPAMAADVYIPGYCAAVCCGAGVR
jgi:hypothetical protein